MQSQYQEFLNSLQLSQKSSSPVWKRKYYYGPFGHSWEECPICHKDYYKWCVKSRYCGQCGYNYSYYRPCNQTGQSDTDFMMQSVYSCRNCGQNKDLDYSCVCQKCSKTLSKEKKLKYVSEIKHQWSKTVETRTLQDKRNQEAMREADYRQRGPVRPYLCGNFCGHCGQC